MRRRSFIVGLLGAGSLGVAGAYLAFFRPKKAPSRRKTIAGASSQQNDLLIPLRDLIPDELEWDALATRLVAEVEVKTVPDLLQALSAKPGFDDLRTEDASIWLKRQAQLDFEADRMVVVKGWYLAEIEGLLLALVWHLQQADRSPAKRGTSRENVNELPGAEIEDRQSSVPVGPIPQGDPKRGEVIYARHCRSCHQSDGKGVGGRVGADLTARPGPLSKSDAALYQAISEGVGDARMPAMGDVLDDREIRDVIAYLREHFTTTQH